MPTVSIVMPAYNAGTYVAESIRSVIAQTMADWELLVVDDGSSDDTCEVVGGFLSDPRIRLLKQKNAGPAAARNRGIREGTGPFVAFLDADDLWVPEKLARTLDEFRLHPEIGLCATGMKVIGPDGAVRGETLGPDRCGQALPDLLSGTFDVLLSSAVVRREVLDRAGLFDESIRLSEDFELWLRVALQCPFRMLAEPLLLYRSGHGNISGTAGDKRRDYVLDAIVPKFMGLPGASVHVRPKHVRALRSLCFKNRADEQTSWGSAVHWYVRAILCRPSAFDAWRALASRMVPRFLVRGMKAILRR